MHIVVRIVARGALELACWIEFNRGWKRIRALELAIGRRQTGGVVEADRVIVGKIGSYIRVGRACQAAQAIEARRVTALLMRQLREADAAGVA